MVVVKTNRMFKTGLSHLISKLSFTNRLNLLKTVGKTSKWSKLVVQLHCNKWSKTAESFIFFNRLPVRLEKPMCSVALLKKWF